MTSATALARLTAALAAPALGLGADTPVAVAVSGGLDSTVLLNALSRLARVGRLRALHIDHGLHADSPRWAEHCRAGAAALGTPLVERRVVVARVPGQSLEDAARAARYTALAELVEPGEVLLTAHHAGDQLETLLYRLLRGTGVRGLRGIAAADVFGRGFIARPLLALTRAEILEIAECWRLRWTEDPSNLDLGFDRNFIRANVVPALLERWPQAPHAAQRLAEAARDAEEILAAIAAQDVGSELDRLELAALRALPAARRRNLLRHATRALGLGSPDARHVERLLALIDDPGIGCVQWPGGEARAYRGRLYLLPSLAELPAPPARRLGPEATVALERGSLALQPTAGIGLPEAWLDDGLGIVFRRGGERFWPLGAARDQALSDWFQAQGIVPWMRDRMPLVTRAGVIVAVGDLALSDQVRAADSRARWRVVWHDRPRVS